jgi:hypothetical protein
LVADEAPADAHETLRGFRDKKASKAAAAGSRQLQLD